MKNANPAAKKPKRKKCWRCKKFFPIEEYGNLNLDEELLCRKCLHARGIEIEMNAERKHPGCTLRTHKEWEYEKKPRRCSRCKKMYPGKEFYQQMYKKDKLCWSCKDELEKERQKEEKWRLVRRQREREAILFGRIEGKKCSGCKDSFPLEEYGKQNLSGKVLCRQCKFDEIHGVRMRRRKNQARAHENRRKELQGQTRPLVLDRPWASKDPYSPQERVFPDEFRTHVTCKSCSKSKPISRYHKHRTKHARARTICDVCYQRVVDAFQHLHDHVVKWGKAFDGLREMSEKGGEYHARSLELRWTMIDKKADEEAELLPVLRESMWSKDDERVFGVLYVKYLGWTLSSYCECCQKTKPRTEFRGLVTPSKVCKECTTKYWARSKYNDDAAV